MGLLRQLLTVLCGTLCVLCFLATTFLTARRFLIIPGTHPLLTQTATTSPSQVIAESLLLPTNDQPLPLVLTTALNNDWQVSSQGVSWLQLGDRAQQRGKILYGHNWPNLLGKLAQTEIGQTIQVRYSDHTQEAYEIQSQFTVSASRLDVLELAKDPDILLIYTCSGWLDRERLVVIARRVSPSRGGTEVGETLYNGEYVSLAK